MGITLFSGTPGSGKSLHGVQLALESLSKGMNVISNFPILPTSYFKKKSIHREIGDYIFVKNTDLTVSALLKYAEENHERNYKAQTLVIIDEAGVMFNSRNFSNEDRMEWIYFLANHRHFNYDFLLIAQMDKMIDRQIRGLIETEVKHRSVRKYKTFGWLLTLITGGLFACIEYWYPCNMRVGSSFIKFNKKIADCYDTMALFIDKDDKKPSLPVKSEEKTEEKKEVEQIGRLAKRKLEKENSGVTSCSDTVVGGDGSTSENKSGSGS